MTEKTYVVVKKGIVTRDLHFLECGLTREEAEKLALKYSKEDSLYGYTFWEED